MTIEIILILEGISPPDRTRHTSQLTVTVTSNAGFPDPGNWPDNSTYHDPVRRLRIEVPY